MSTARPAPAGRPDPSARARLRRRLLTAAVLLLPIVELTLLIQVGGRLGVGVTLLLLLAAGVAGVLVLRYVGSTAIRRLTEASAGPSAAGQAPARARPGAETALLVVAGVLLILPGFLSDLVALALLVPAVRRALVRRAGEAVLRRFQVRTVRVVAGEVVDDDGGPGTSRPFPADVRVIQAPPPGEPTAR